MFQRFSLWALVLTVLVGTVLVGGLATPAQAGIKVYEKDGKSVELGGTIQLQYHLTDPDGGDSEDEIFFRRLRPYIEASITPDWTGKFEFDLGKAVDGDEIAVKDATMQYSGFKNLEITLGNQKPPFSREFLTSSKRQQLVERSFVGDHNYGAPDRMLGLKVDGHNESKKVQWGASFGSADVDPDAKKLDFDSPATANSDFNQGWLVAGRVDFHPLGAMKMDQGAWGDETKYTVGVGVFSWANDDDNNTYTAGGKALSSSKIDIDKANGFELSGGLRSGSFSADAQYNRISADAVDGAFSGGLFSGGNTDLDVYALEAGYNFNKKYELVAGYDSLDATGYRGAWTRTSLGLNYFWSKHDVKAQLTYRMGENLNGVRGQNEDELFLQFQYVF